MNELLAHRTRRLEKRLLAAALLLLLLTSLTALLTRYDRSLSSQVRLYRLITDRLPLMKQETKDYKAAIAALQTASDAGAAASSRDLLLYSRLDQVKATLQPSEMSVAAKTTAKSMQSITFNLTLPPHTYAQAVNRMGTLQTASHPFVAFTALHLENTAAGLKVEGAVHLPIPEKSP